MNEGDSIAFGKKQQIFMRRLSRTTYFARPQTLIHFLLSATGDENLTVYDPV